MFSKKCLTTCQTKSAMLMTTPLIQLAIFAHFQTSSSFYSAYPMLDFVKQHSWDCYPTTHSKIQP